LNQASGITVIGERHVFSLLDHPWFPNVLVTLLSLIGSLNLHLNEISNELSENLMARSFVESVSELLM